MVILNALTCFLLLPGIDGVLATKAHPAVTHSESFWTGYNVPASSKSIHSSCKGLWLWWEKELFLKNRKYFTVIKALRLLSAFFFSTFICIHKHKGLSQYWYGPAGCSAHHIGRVNIATVIRKNRKLMWGENLLTTKPKNRWNHTTQGISTHKISGLIHNWNLFLITWLFQQFIEQSSIQLA